ncbi:hypothetical protein KA005_11175 [bacterium]|nr:hypothetical protein [bacterium]
MKRSDLYVFQEGLEMAQLKGAKFTYAVTKNKRRLESEIKIMEKAKEPDKSFKEFEKEIDALYKEYADKDVMGKPKMKKIMVSATKSSWQYIIPGLNDPESKYGKAVAVLRKKHKEALEAQEKKEEEYQEFLKEESEWKPFMIDLAIVPDDIHQTIMDRIIWMIKDTEKL